MRDSSQARLPAITAADNAEERTAQINSIRDHAARISRVPGPGSDPIWIDTDGDGFVIDWHPAAPAVLGLSAQHLKRDLALMFIVGRPQRYQLTLAMHSRMEEFDAVIVLGSDAECPRAAASNRRRLTHGSVRRCAGRSPLALPSSLRTLFRSAAKRF